MFGALLFFVGLQIEYHFGLLPPGSGTLYVLNQIMFLVAMCCIVVMLWGMRAVRAGGDGRFARIMLTLFPTGWAILVLATIISFRTGNNDNLLFPLGGLMNMLFGLLAGIAVAVSKRWTDWTRYALLLQSVYYLLVMVIGTIIVTGSIEPSRLTESLWMVTWFLASLALALNGQTAVVQPAQ
jgi:hypothetical protein